MSELKTIKPNPTDLLARQVQQLASIDVRLEKMQAQLESLRRNQVKIIDVNMPFWALVGFIIKLALASVPAGVALGAIYLFILMLVGSSCTALLGGS